MSGKIEVNKTVKPILIVRVNYVLSKAEYDDLTGFMLEKGISDDYYVLPIGNVKHNDRIEFEVFYEKDFNEVKYEELKKIITDSLKK